MATTLGLKQAHHQARLYLDSLVYQMSTQSPDYDTAFDQAEKLCSYLKLCCTSQAAITRQKGNADGGHLARVFTERGDQS
ncbi:hypothetical protein [Rhodoferax sp.]|uniref:hypothetical protein n=1 Tax=Rhodoferax sp. TaxID=50421 RepID=UPI002721DDF7|nr:hypothetical protein [Rhodoferax sp.]MDO8320604.1 hypothetical protein [Rhodoferax sp.]